MTYQKTYSERLYEVLQEGKNLVESTIAHVSHGGPTRADAEAWLEKAKEALAEPDDNPIKWNPFNRVVQDHRDGTVDHEATNREREKRGLPVPWTPRMGDKEVREKPIE